MDASAIPKGQSTEKTDGREVNLPGIYEHKDTKGIYITAEGEDGVIQADALMSPVWRDAWHRVGDVPSRVELLKIRKAQELKDAKEAADEKKAEEAEIAAAVAGGEHFEPALATK
jgi:hypothetical protein